MEQCKNCEALLNGPYCSACGQKGITERLTVRHMLGELIQSITNVERGFWYTMQRLMAAPGQVVREYVEGKRKRYFHPVRYLLILATLATVLTVWLGIFDLQQDEILSVQERAMGLEPSEQSRLSQEKVQEQIKPYLNLITLLTLPFVSLVSLWLFRKRDYNYAEHLAINAYWTAQLSFIGLLPVFFFAFFPQAVGYLFPLSILLSVIYYTFGFRQLFGVSYGQAVWKGFLTNTIGFILMFISIIIVVFLGIFIYIVFSKIFLH